MTARTVTHVIAITTLMYSFALSSAAQTTSIYGFKATGIDGKEISLSEYRGKIALIVNVASKCGFTPQYTGLETIYKKYNAQGFVILGFPANNFGGQEPGTNAEIAQFCSATYGVSFPMFAKISVKGADIHPLYAYLTSEKTNAGFSGDITWNFSKFLVDGSGKVIARFDPKVTPESDAMIKAIETALSKK